MTRTSQTLVCGFTENSARATTAFAASLARSLGWHLCLCPLPRDGRAATQLDALVDAAAREDAALAVIPRVDDPDWMEAFVQASITARCLLIAVPADAATPTHALAA
jgi:hypothetical protein